MVTMRRCDICSHDIDLHNYTTEEIDTVLGKQRLIVSHCSNDDCTCNERKIERFKKEMIDQKEHG